MLAEKHYQIQSLLEKSGVLFCYSGYMNEDLLSGLGQAIKHKMLLEDTDNKTVRSVFSIFVEQMQNVIRYSVERESEGAMALSFGLLTVGLEEESYYVTCGNKIENSDVMRLDQQLSAIRSMNRDELKAYYKKVLKGETPEGSKGAGVGFIDIARKATRPIEFDFLELDEEHSFFSLKAFI